MFTINFNVLSQHIDEAVQNLPSTLRNHGFKIIGLREADIVSDYDNSKQGEVYVWRCQGSVYNYLKFKKFGNYKEITYEGKRTLQ